MTFSRRARIARATVLLTAAGIAAATLPGATAQAVVDTPQFGYIECSTGDATTCDQVLWSGPATGSSPAPVALTPTSGHYQTYSYDMTESGDTWVVGLRHGPVVDDGFDSTTGLVLVHRGSGPGHPVTSRVLSTSWEANPVIRRSDGKFVWWLSGGVLHKFTASYDETTGAISGTASTMAAPALAGGPLEIATRLAVSPGGLHAAVLFHNDTVDGSGAVTNHRDRVVAAYLLTQAGATQPYFQKTYDTSGSDKTAPLSNTFTFTDETTLLYDEYQFAAGSSPTAVSAVSATIPSSGPRTSATTAVPALDDYYDVHAMGSGPVTYWAWKDTAGSPLTSTAGSTTDLGTAPTPLSGPRDNGDTSYRYVPTSSTPAPMPSAANRATAHAHLVLSAKRVLSGKRPAFWGYNLYLQPAVGSTYSDAYADEVDAGTLHWQAVGTQFVGSQATSGSGAFQAGSATYLGYTPTLSRNTYVWWSYSGDYLTRPGSSAKSLVVVVPRMGLSVKSSGIRHIVYGHVARRYGGVTLYRVRGSSLQKIATAKITAQGDFSFGSRVLYRGTYKVISAGDKYWAQAAARTTI
ncbi:MAG: hypothetical protein GC157_12545 [Frankiales bacterium]|nr:hypothetical protein [Frankiales bacterium]